jgi:mono/diheme cytochrome c family protein
MNPVIKGALMLAFTAGLTTLGGHAAQAQAFGAAGHFPQQDGEAIFKAVCQGCHMPDAKGAIGAGAYPALANNSKLEVGGYPVYVIVNGQKAMPAFGGSFDDNQIANVVNYVRTHFGNNYTDPASAEDVKAARPAPAQPAHP